MIYQQSFQVETPGRGLKNITEKVAEVVSAAHVTTGLCHVFIHHTSASLIINENADSDVLKDLNAFMNRLVPDGDAIYAHTIEGPDDMPAHVRSILTQTSLTIPISHAKLDLGTWQGIFLWEHRIKPYTRKITVTIQA